MQEVFVSDHVTDLPENQKQGYPFFLVSFIRILYYKSDRSGTPSTMKKRRTT